MNGPRIQDVKALFPPDDELRPLLDRLVATSSADPERRWAASGELGTVGERFARPELVRSEVRAMVEHTTERMTKVYGATLDAIEALARDDRSEASAALLRAAEIEETAGRWAHAEEFASAARRISEGLRDRRPVARALRIAARCARARGRLRDAERWYEDAFETARLAGALNDAVVAGTGRGNVAVDRGRWHDAAIWYAQALELLAGGPPRRERWQLYQNLSIVERELGRLEEARGHLDRAEAEARAVGDGWASAEIGNSRGQIALAAGDPVRAEDLLREALRDAPGGKARTAILLNLAQALLAANRTLEAAEVAREAEKEAITHDVVGHLPEVYRVLARISTDRGHEEAFVFYERALDWSGGSADAPYQRAQTHEAYARLEAARGDVESARARLREAAELYEKGGNDADRDRVQNALAAGPPNGDDS